MENELIKILIIDDEADLCFLLSGMLRAQGYVVNYYHTVKDGFDGILGNKPHWVIIDNNLPDGLGWEKANDILATNESIHIIKISANPDSPHTDNRHNVHYLIKPIKVQGVVDLIKKYTPN